MSIGPDTLILIGVLIPSVILHEVTHGWVALQFGDRTAQAAGRLTLNPVPHIDPFGTVILPAMLAVLGGGVFGYARPVPVNPGNMRDPRNQGMWTALAGPATNILLAVAAGLVLRFLGPEVVIRAFDAGEVWVRVLVAVGTINVVLAAFNLIPLPPLDGSSVIERFLPVSWLGGWHQLRQYSMLLVLGLVLLLPGALTRVFDVAFDVWALLI